MPSEEQLLRMLVRIERALSVIALAQMILTIILTRIKNGKCRKAETLFGNSSVRAEEKTCMTENWPCMFSGQGMLAATGSSKTAGQALRFQD